jgi:putative acetyltransferase
MEEIEIRESLSGDVGSIERLYPTAFPDEDLLPVVRDLLKEGPAVLSLVATVDGTLAGHVMFTACGLAGQPGTVSLLAPLAVAPAHQRRGIGSALVRAGLQRVKDNGALKACVLDDPAYYGRLGFEPEADITPPYDLPEAWHEAWQSLGLTETAQPVRGRLVVPRPWHQPALWLP